MRYPWISLSVLGIWIVSSIIAVVRPEVKLEYVFGYTFFSTIVLVAVGFRVSK